MRQHGLSDDGERIVLHRFHGGVETSQPADSSPVHRFLFVDVETTGLQPGVDRLIELALIEVDVQVETGLVVAHHGTESWLEDPGIPIPPEITELTGISDQDVQGQKIPADTVRTRFEAARILVAHNARFDRAMSVARFPWLGEPGAPSWACSFEQIDWKGYGHRHANLLNLAMDHGFFYAGHRATIDVEALIKLLAMRPADDAPPYLCDLVADIRQPYFLLAASGTPFDAKDELKLRGYRWDAEQKHWFTTLPEAELETERDWIRELCARHGRGQPKAAKIPLAHRFDQAYEPIWQAG
jgi:DNA polymerase-3 subunit epsilon